MTSPGDPAILWTSVATGKTADQHGILSALECDPMSGKLRLTRGSRRKTKAVWNIAMQAGLSAHVAGWYAATPAEPLNGSSITNEFVVPTGPVGTPWPILNGAIHPEEIAGMAAELRLHPAEFHIRDLYGFMPSLAGIDPSKDERVAALADILAREISMHAIATSIMEKRAWNLLMIGWHALGRACARFMQYAPPRMAHVSEEDFAAYAEVVNGIYRFSDMLLGRVLELAGPEATIMIVSPAAYRTGAERPVSPATQRLPAAWYRQFGVLCMAGPEIVPDHLVHGTNALDVAPTILSALGLAPGADMPGHVIDGAFVDGAFVEMPRLERVASWDQIPGDCGMLAPESEADAEIAAAAIAELAGEGYVEPPQNGIAAAVNRQKLFNGTMIHLAAGRYQDARPLLVQLAAEAPTEGLENTRIRLWLAHCHLVCGDRDACRAAMLGLSREGPAGALASLLDAQLAFLEGASGQAQDALHRAQTQGADLPIVNYAAAVMFLLMSSWDRAEKLLRRAIALDPSFQAAHNMLARLLSHRGDSTQAAEFARSGLEIDYASAFSHFALGLAMVGARDGDQALEAFENSLAWDPNLQQARSWVAALRAEQEARASRTHE